MPVLPEAVQPRSAPAPPPEILLCTGVPSGEQAIEPAALVRKAVNREYFRGEQHVDRVQAWRTKNPGYWRKPALIVEPLQELILTQADDPVGKSGSLALQETRSGQIPNPRQKSGSLGRAPLQDGMVNSACRLVACYRSDGR